MDEQQEQYTASAAQENDPASSALPYHTAATEQIQADREKDVEDKDEDEPFTFEMHGYKVQQRKAEGTEKGFADENGDVFDVVGDNDFHRVYGNKRDAVVFAQTTSADFTKNGNIPVV